MVEETVPTPHVCCSCTADGYGCCEPGHDEWFDDDDDEEED